MEFQRANPDEFRDELCKPRIRRARKNTLEAILQAGVVAWSKSRTIGERSPLGTPLHQAYAPKMHPKSTR